MSTGVLRTWWQFVAVMWLATVAQTLRAEWPVPLFMPEQRTIDVRDPSQLPHAPLPHTPPPPTITNPHTELPQRMLSLDEAIRTALANAEVVRVLAGVVATASGSTIYDAAITNTSIDEQRARFDPTVAVENGWNRVEKPLSDFDDPTFTTSHITGLRTDNYKLNAGLSKTTTLGGTASLNVNAGPTFAQPGVFPLNPESRPSLGLQLTQPLLQGAGRPANLAPIVLARIDTERSYFQFKDSVQKLVRSVIEAYWSIVFARTDVWAREQQVKQAQFAYDRTVAAFEVGSADVGETAQAKTASGQLSGQPARRRAPTCCNAKLPSATYSAFPPTIPNKSRPLRHRSTIDWKWTGNRSCRWPKRIVRT